MHRKLIIFSFVLLSLLFARETFAYDENTTHPALTQEIVDYYNLLNTSQSITSEQKEWIILGSTLEDTAPRWANHFYDPVRKIGWTGAGAGNVPAETARALAIVGLPTDRILPATEWVTNNSVQEKYLNYGGNWTWGKGLEYFAAGDEEKAYIALGHALHLLEDMSVPEHTRDDTHIALNGVIGDEGSPYENYLTSVNRSNIEEWNIIPTLQSSGAVPPQKTTIADYFASLAEYSNKYFFSKDTIGDLKYQFPKVLKNDNEFGYGLDENGIEFPLVKVGSLKKDGEIKTIYSLDKNDSNIFTAYFSRLSRKAVLYGAGVIQLFQKQAADAVINKDFPVHIVKYDFSFITPPSFSLIGEVSKLYSAGQRAVVSVTQIFSKQEEKKAASDTGMLRSTAAPQLLPRGTEMQMVNKGNESNATVLNLVAPMNKNENQQSETTPLAFSSGGGTSVEMLAPSQTTVQYSESTSTAESTGAATTTVETATSTATSTTETATSTAPAATSTETTATSTVATSTPISLAGSVLISEIQTSGANAGDEFIELYNTSSSEIDLSSWSVQYVGGDTTTTEHVEKKNFVEGNKIGSYGFFLIARNSSSSTDDGYRGSVVPDLAHRSFALSNRGAVVFLVGDKEPISAFDDADIIDAVSYPELQVNQSAERKALTGSVCISPQNGGEFLGNGCDAGTADDFEIRLNPHPQNSSNLPEPRLAPTTPVIIATSSVSSTIGFEWLPSVDGADATSTVSYRIFEVSSSSNNFISETTSTSFLETISEFDREYSFLLQAFDRDTMPSIATSVTIFAASVTSTATSTEPVATSTTPLFVQQIADDSASSTVGQEGHQAMNFTLDESNVIHKHASYVGSWSSITLHLADRLIDNGFPLDGNNSVQAQGLELPDCDGKGMFSLSYGQIKMSNELTYTGAGAYHFTFSTPISLSASNCYSFNVFFRRWGVGLYTGYLVTKGTNDPSLYPDGQFGILGGQQGILDAYFETDITIPAQ